MLLGQRCSEPDQGDSRDGGEYCRPLVHPVPVTCCSSRLGDLSDADESPVAALDSSVVRPGSHRRAKPLYNW